MCSATVERSHITVKSAGAHSAMQEISKGTSAFTLEKNLTSAHIAITHVLTPLLLNNTCPNIQQMTNFVLQYDAEQTIQNCMSIKFTNRAGFCLVIMMMMMMVEYVWVWLAPVVRLGWSGPVPLTELKPLPI